MKQKSPSIYAQLIFFITIFFAPHLVLMAATVTAPNQCLPTPTFPAGSACPAGQAPIITFTENFDAGFGVFTEDSPPGPATTGANDLTLSTNGDTPSAGTGPETTASCTGPTSTTNEGEFIFLEGSTTQAGETHCMTTSLDLTGLTAPLNLSFWYHMFGDNIEDLEVNINAVNESTVTGQQHVMNGDPWIQGLVDLSAHAGNIVPLQICMSEGNGAVSTFESDISIDQIQVFNGCAPIVIPTTEPIPTLSEWGLFILIGSMMLMLMFNLQRRRFR